MGRLQHKRGRPSNYRRSFKNNPYWNTVKRKVNVRDKHRCVICGLPYPLERHHISYKVDGNTILGKELEYLEWICVLCEKCHTEVHKNITHPLNPKNIYKINVKEYKKLYGK